MLAEIQGLGSERMTLLGQPPPLFMGRQERETFVPFHESHLQPLWGQLCTELVSSPCRACLRYTEGAVLLPVGWPCSAWCLYRVPSGADPRSSGTCPGCGRGERGHSGLHGRAVRAVLSPCPQCPGHRGPCRRDMGESRCRVSERMCPSSKGETDFPSCYVSGSRASLIALSFSPAT